jgi:hypothetical protein
MFLAQSVGDAFVGEADEFGKRRMLAAGSARQRRNEGGQRREGVAVERPKIDRMCRTASRTTYPKEPMPHLESAADRRREQHRHPLGLPLIPRRDKAAGVLEDPRLGRVLCGRFLFGGGGALRLHLASIEAHRRVVGRRVGTLVKQRYMLSVMCGRYTYKLTWEEIVRLYRLTLDQPPENTRARFNVCPTTTIDTIVGVNNKRTLVPMRWGLVPSWWSKTLKELKLAVSCHS